MDNSNLASQGGGSMDDFKYYEITVAKQDKDGSTKGLFSFCMKALRKPSIKKILEEMPKERIEAGYTRITGISRLSAYEAKEEYGFA